MFELRKYQKDCVEAGMDYLASSSKKKGIIVAPTGCHSKGYVLPLINGDNKKVEDIRIGDKLIGDNGRSITVIDLHYGIDDMYEINPIKGVPFIVNKDHILSLYRIWDGKMKKSEGYDIDEITVGEYINKNKWYKHIHKLRRVEMVYYENNKSLPLHPYFLGLLLGDGSSDGSVGITTRWNEVVDYVYNFAKSRNLGVRKVIKNNGDNLACSYFITDGRGKGKPKEGRNGVINELKEIGLFGKKAGDKFIPEKYKTSSIENRLYLLAGLVDTDSYYDNKNNGYEYCTKSYTMAKDIETLCRSLGFYCLIGKCKIVNGNKYYRIQITGDLSIIPNRVNKRRGRPYSSPKNRFVTGFTVKHIGKGEYFGFTLDGNHLYCDNQFFIHHNSGKSIIISDIARRIGKPTLVLQPSKELLEQNHSKLTALGGTATIYSASCGSKDISSMMYATLGSVKKVIEELKEIGVRHVLIDEAHAGYSPEEGSEFMEFMKGLNPKKVIGFTASPCRLKTYSGIDGSYSKLNMINRTIPRYFGDILHVTQVREMIDLSFWSDLDYEVWNNDDSGLLLNSTGAEYTKESVMSFMRDKGLNNAIMVKIMRCMEVHDSIMVFMDSVENCHTASRWLNNKKGDVSCVVHGGMSMGLRSEAVNGFKCGKYKVAFNHSALGTGFDHPGVDCIIMGRPTFSFQLYYQVLGRGVRIKDGKSCCKIIDACDNYKRFGDIREMSLDNVDGYGWGMFSGDRLMTGFPMGERVLRRDVEKRIEVVGKKHKNDKMPGRPDNPMGDVVVGFGKHKGTPLRLVPASYLQFIDEKFDRNDTRNKMFFDYINFLKNR